MTDYADLLLEGNPEKESQTDYADLLLSGGKIEAPVGGTYVPRKFSRGTPSGTSAITGKQVTEYYPGKEPEASFGAQMKATYADTPWGKIKAFAASRGIPTEEVPSRYRVGKGGEIEFKDKQGNWNREIGEAKESKMKGFAAQVVAHPSTYLGTAGAAVGGVPGAVGGAMTGEFIRKGVAKTVFGEKVEPWSDLTDVAMEGVFALGGEMAGKLVSSVFNRFLSRRAGVVAKAGIGSKEAALTAQDHAKALMLKALAQKHGIELGPHQIYDKQSILNTWKYLRNHPLTSDPIKAFEDVQQGATEESIQGFIREMGGYKETATALGEKVQGTAGQIIDKAEATRTKRVAPKYAKAAVEAEKAGGVTLDPIIDKIDGIAKSYPEGSSKGSLLRIKKSLMTKEELPAGTQGPLREQVPEHDLRKIQKAIFDLNDLIEGTSQEAAQIAPSSKKVLNRDLEILKKDLLAQIEKVSPEFAKANKLYEKMSPPIDRLKSSVIGELTRMKSDKTIAAATHKVLDVSNMPDPELLRRAKTVIQKKDRDLWNEMVGSYVRDVFESLRVTEEGHVVNAAGKLYKRLYGGKQGEIMKAAIEGLPQEQTFKELMEIYQRAALGYSKESMTAPFLEIRKGLDAKLGTFAYQLAKQPKDKITEMALGRWEEMWMSGRHKKLMDALTSPDVIEKIKKIKRLSPKSSKFIEAFGVFTAFVSDRYIEGTP